MFTTFLDRVSKARRRQGSKQKVAAAARPVYEALESRRMLTVMTVDGTAAADTIALTVGGGLVTASVNGSNSVQSDLLVTSIVIDGLDSNDTININSTGTNSVTINAGNGNDTINLAAASQDMDDVAGDVTINGDGGTDVAVLSDQNSSVSNSFGIVGAAVTRGASSATYTAGSGLETMTINAGAGSNIFSVTGVPAMELSIDGNGGNNSIQYHGAGTENVVYRPSAATTNAGTLDFGAHGASFADCADLFTLSVNNLLVNMNRNDTLTISQTSATNNKIDGTTDGVAMASMSWNNVTVAAQVNLGFNDNSISATNVATVTGSMVAAPRLDLFYTGANLAGTYSNTLNVQGGGTWTIDVSGPNFKPIDVNVTGTGTTLNFSGPQTLHRLQIDNGATAKGTFGNDITTSELAVTAGTGNLSPGSGGFISVTNGGTFSIGAGCTLNVNGPDSFIVQANQSHGAGATLNVPAAGMQMFTDAGSTSARPLTITTGGTSTFFHTEHLNALNVAAGTTSVTASGNLVIVTNSVSTGSEGGELNLRDNHLILDYTGTTAVDDIRLLLKKGFDNGAWDGLGINSSSAGANPGHHTGLGFAEATDFNSSFPASFRGETIDNSAILVSYTLYGDVNLNRKVDLTDFTFLAANFNTINQRWARGDFNFDTKIDLTDFTFLASNFNSTLPGAASASAAAPPAAASFSETTIQGSTLDDASLVDQVL